MCQSPPPYLKFLDALHDPTVSNLFGTLSNIIAKDPSLAAVDSIKQYRVKQNGVFPPKSSFEHDVDTYIGRQAASLGDNIIQEVTNSNTDQYKRVEILADECRIAYLLDTYRLIEGMNSDDIVTAYLLDGRINAYTFSAKHNFDLEWTDDPTDDVDSSEELREDLKRLDDLREEKLEALRLQEEKAGLELQVADLEKEISGARAKVNALEKKHRDLEEWTASVDSKLETGRRALLQVMHSQICRLCDNHDRLSLALEDACEADVKTRSLKVVDYFQAAQGDK